MVVVSVCCMASWRWEERKVKKMTAEAMAMARRRTRERIGEIPFIGSKGWEGNISVYS